MWINTICIDIDTLVKEQVVLNKDGSYTIFLNARMSHEMQAEAYKHALEHIRNGDFNKGDTDQIEKKAHGL